MVPRAFRVAMLASGVLLAAGAPDVRPAPPAAPDSLPGLAGAAVDPAVLWTFDSGG